MSDARPKAPECERLAAELSALRERTGLSLAALGDRTPYSKSSWQRYLNGTKPLSRQAVEALCKLANEPPGRLLALWELADAAWSGRAGGGSLRGDAHAGAGTGTGTATGVGVVPPSVPVSVGPGESPRKRRRAPVIVVVAAAVVAVSALLAVSLALDGGGGEGEERRDAADASWLTATPVPPGCAGPTCEGHRPSIMGCGGPGMVTNRGSFTTTGGQRLELRYSEMCGAMWVRATGLRLGDRVALAVPGGQVQEIEPVARRNVGRYLSTPMARAVDPDEARVCLRPEGGAGQECFGGGPTS